MNLKKRLTITFISLMSLPVILMITSIIVMIVYRNPQVSRSLVVEAIWVMVIILIIYAILLTTWVNRGVFLHIRELNTAMDHISEGDFDYVLDASQVDGEFAELFKSYEDMRLRLKESSEDRLRDEAQNR